jgi:hypothetical protein
VVSVNQPLALYSVVGHIAQRIDLARQAAGMIVLELPFRSGGPADAVRIGLRDANQPVPTVVLVGRFVAHRIGLRYDVARRIVLIVPLRGSLFARAVRIGQSQCGDSVELVVVERVDLT